MDLQSVQRARLEDAANLVDGRWVLTWKLIENELGKEVKGVKGRWTLRGFEDQQTHVETFSGTVTRFGSRSVDTQAVQEAVDLWSFDIIGTFLKGLTFDEINKVGNNGLLRKVCWR